MGPIGTYGSGPRRGVFRFLRKKISLAAKLETQRQPKRNVAEIWHPTHPQMDFSQRNIFHGKRSNKTSSIHKSCGVELAGGCPAQRSNVPHGNGLGLNWAETGPGRDQAECRTGLDQAGAMPHLDRAALGSGWHWAGIQPGRDRAGSKPGQARTGLGPGWWVKFGWDGSQFSRKLDAESDPQNGLPRTSLAHGGLTNLIRYSIQLFDECLS